MRILHILDHSLPMHSGYTFRTRAIMKAQIERGHTVLGITGRRHLAPGPAHDQVDGLDFWRTPARHGAEQAGPSPLAEFREVRALEQSVAAAAASFRPDVLHAHSPVLGALAGLRVARSQDLPLLYEIRAFWEDAAVGNGTGREGNLKYRAIQAIETCAVRRADAVAVICEGLRRDLISRGIDEGRIVVSPNGVDMTLFGAPSVPDPALARKLGLIDADVIGYIGSFYDYEGIDDLIAAMPAIVAVLPKARLLLVGGGPMEAALRAQAAASTVAAHIIFVGRVPHDRVEDYYALIDVLVYPRKRMRLTDLVTPLKPLEAMAQRRLVAASSVGGHRELIEDGITGTLFAPDDPAAIARALTAMFADRSNWDERRDRARSFVETERNWSSNIARYEPVYERIAASQARKGTA